MSPSSVVWWFCWFKGRHDKLTGTAWNLHNLLWNWWPVYINVIDMYVTMYVCMYVRMLLIITCQCSVLFSEKMAYTTNRS